MKSILYLVLFSFVSCALEKAPYDVIKEYDGWEHRKFPPTKWISTDDQDVKPHDGPSHGDAFHRLFSYIDGSNENNSKIPMTAPVSMIIFPGTKNF